MHPRAPRTVSSRCPRRWSRGAGQRAWNRRYGHGPTGTRRGAYPADVHCSSDRGTPEDGEGEARSIAADLETFDEQLLTDKERRQIKFTEQGETIAAKYANPSIVERELEQMLNAQVRARVNATEHPTEPVDRSGWRPWRRRPTPHTRDTRHCSVPRGFVEYFEQATPITVIEDINLGSRPASRSGERTVGDLREIPWVFS